MNLNTIYYVEYRACPTSWNAPVTLQLGLHGLITMVELGTMCGKERVELSAEAKRNGHSYSQGVVIQKIYTETDNERTVHYKDGHYGENHISQWLRETLRPVVKEVLA